MRTVAIFRFHAASAVRVALRFSTLKLLVLVVAIGLSANPGLAVLQLALGLSTGDGWRWAPLLVAMWVLGDAQVAARRLQPAARGWHLHLPAAAVERRRAAWLALLAVQLPVLSLWLLAWVGTAVSGRAVRLELLLALPVVATGAAYAVLPLRKPWARGLGLAALALGCLGGGWLWLLVALACLGLAEAAAGSLRIPRARGLVATSAGHSSRYLLEHVALRAIGTRLLVPFLVAALILAAVWLFLGNNELSASQAGVAVRTGCGLALVLIQLQLAGLLKSARPPWGWSRSLPWSSRRRVLHDAGLLAVTALPVLFACVRFHPGALPALIALSGYVATRLSAALRHQQETISSLGSFAVTEALLWTLAVGVSGWTGVLLLVLLPWAVGNAARQEQQVKVSRWLERHHAALGDPAS